MSKILESSSKPKMEFIKNDLLDRVFDRYDKTFAKTLDREDYWKQKHLEKFRNFTWKLMCKSLRKISPSYRKIIKWHKVQDLIKEKKKLQRLEKIKAVANAVLKGIAFDLKKANVSVCKGVYSFVCCKLKVFS